MTSARWQAKAPTRSRRFMRPPAEAALFARDRDPRDLARRRLELTVEVGRAEANANARERAGGAWLRVLGSRDELDLRKRGGALRVARQLPAHARHHRERGQGCCNFPFHEWLLHRARRSK